jgi:1,4-dihydroxy-2-naphthoate polyprenyltransferase
MMGATPITNKKTMTDNAAAVAVEPTPERLENPLKRYFLATRPPFLLASVAPCLVGLATAYDGGVQLNWLAALLTLVGAVLFHAAANVLNDYYDALNGTDAMNTERLYPFTGGSRFIQNGVLTPMQTARYGFSLLAAGIVVGLLLLEQSGSGLLVIGLAGTVIAWAYSAPPLSLNSRGLGELSIATAFGLLIIVGTDYVQRGGFDLSPLLAAIPYGLLTSSLLYINQFPDREADARAGKHHLVVRLGANKARWGYLLLVLFANLYLVGLVLVGLFTPWILLALLAAPAGMTAAVILLRHASEPPRLGTAIPLTILSVLLHGVLLAAGLVVGG